jgi:hypothetical protein
VELFKVPPYVLPNQLLNLQPNGPLRTPRTLPKRLVPRRATRSSRGTATILARSTAEC